MYWAFLFNSFFVAVNLSTCFSPLAEKTFSAARTKMFCGLRQPSNVQWFDKIENKCLSFKLEKQNWYSTALFALCVWVFSLKIWQCQNDLDEKKLILVFTAPLLKVSSNLKEVFFIRPVPSALFSNHSPKSNTVGRIRIGSFFFGVCTNLDSLNFGGSFELLCLEEFNCGDTSHTTRTWRRQRDWIRLWKS